jgi:DNA-binding response OmpR family regulator
MPGVTHPTKPLKVLVYSDDVTVRQQVIGALGAASDGSLPTLECVEVATEAVVLEQAEDGGIALLVLDGQAVPASGYGVAKRLKGELDACPPMIVLTNRPEDSGLAAWSGADASVAHPVDGAALATAAAGLLRSLVDA